jgi:hypothetical protein
LCLSYEASGSAGFDQRVAAGPLPERHGSLDQLALLAEATDQILERRAPGDAGDPLEEPDQGEHVARDLLPHHPGGPAAGAEVPVPLPVAAPQVGVETVEQIPFMPLQLRREPLDHGLHQAGPPVHRHVAEDVRRVQPLEFRRRAQQPREPVRHRLHDRPRAVVLAEQRAVPLDRPERHRQAVAAQIQGELHATVEHVGLGRLRRRPVPELHQEHQAAHRVQFLGRMPEEPVEVPSHPIHGHRLKNALPENSGPALPEAPDRDARIRREIDVEKLCLSGVVRTYHSPCKLLEDRMIQYRKPWLESEAKNDRRDCAANG